MKLTTLQKLQLEVGDRVRHHGDVVQFDYTINQSMLDNNFESFSPAARWERLPKKETAYENAARTAPESG
jgi:hypothetical protein